MCQVCTRMCYTCMLNVSCVCWVYIYCMYMSRVCVSHVSQACGGYQVHVCQVCVCLKCVFQEWEVFSGMCQVCRGMCVSDVCEEYVSGVCVPGE